MFLVLSTVAEALRRVPHFETWDVRDGMSTVSRQAFPAVDLRIEGAGVAADGLSMVTVSPGISVRLIAERGADVAADLDAAFVAVIAALHGLRLQEVGGRAWSWLKLSVVRDLPVIDVYVGCELVFVTEAQFGGLHCDC